MTRNPFTGPESASAPDPLDRIDAVLAEVALDYCAGRIDEAEAIQRLIEAGCTPAGAEIHVARWRDGTEEH
jgi:hypothetical protein